MLWSFGLWFRANGKTRSADWPQSRRLCLCGFEGLQRVRLGLPTILFTGLERQGLGELNGNATEEAIYVIYAANMP
jgi:hypothetical protein